MVAVDVGPYIFDIAGFVGEIADLLEPAVEVSWSQIWQPLQQVVEIVAGSYWLDLQKNLIFHKYRFRKENALVGPPINCHNI